MALAAAAIGGTRRGRERGKLIASARERARRAAARDLEQQKHQLENRILAGFDKDGSGGISKIELVPLLSQCSLELFCKEIQPSPDDVEFLFNLCCSENNTSCEIQRKEVLGLVDAWKEFVKAKDRIVQLVQNNDADQDDRIDLHELQAILDEIKDFDQLRIVQSEVTTWIFSQADISRNGVLSLMEVARALCAYDLWLGKRTRCPFAPEKMMEGIQQDLTLEAPAKLSEKDWKQYQHSKAKILSLLKQHDVNGDSVFQLQEMTAFLVKLGVPEGDSAQFHKDMDVNGDSVVSVDEFLNWVYCPSKASDLVLSTIVPQTTRSCAIS